MRRVVRQQNESSRKLLSDKTTATIPSTTDLTDESRTTRFIQMVALQAIDIPGDTGERWNVRRK